MTVFEHAMLGGSLAVATGFHRRYGWSIAATAATAAVIPDWDGVSLLFGGRAYDLSHRAWGHNVFFAVVAGSLVGLAGLAGRHSERIRAIIGGARQASWTGNQSTRGGSMSVTDVIAWVGMGVVAMLSHLPIDVVYSWHPQMEPWPVRLFWPLSGRGYAMPVIAWGDVGATTVFIGEMFALYRWPDRAQQIAGLALGLVFAYIALRAAIG
jgi:membrane-bound metal-dependent hydrolase YbcI (DUF457 family)